MEGLRINNLVLFLIVAAAMVFLFFFGIKYLSKGHSKNKIILFEELAERLGFSFFAQDSIGLKKKIDGLIDFGLIDESIDNIVIGKNREMEIYFFSCDDEPISSGLKDMVVPTWSVCLLETKESFKFDISVFQKKVWFGKIKKYKFFSKDWHEVKMKNLDLEKYVIMTTDPLRFDKVMNDGLMDVFLKYSKTYRGKLIPQCISLQIKDNLLTLYADQFNFDSPDEFIECYNHANEIYEIMKRN